MTTIIKRCRGEKKRSTRSVDGFTKKLMIPDSEIPCVQSLKLNQNREAVYEWKYP